MKPRIPLTVAERESIYRETLNGQPLAELAEENRCSYICARKWWRIGREQGLAGLRRTGRSRSGSGLLSTFDRLVAERALYWKHLHPKRGPTRVLQDMVADECLSGQRLPKRSALAAFFCTACPELLQKRQSAPERPTRSKHVHECWQIDSKEDMRLGDGTIASVLDVREPVACFFLGSQAHLVQTEKAWRKLTLQETQSDLRLVFAAFGLPDGIQTDRESLYGQPPAEGFPSRFTLWLVGLGVRHHFSRPHQPTDQPQVERGHRTLCNWMAQAKPAPDLQQLQSDLDQARHLHNEVLPSSAGDCRGRTPLQVHPEVLRLRRPFHPSLELDLFSLKRVEQFLAQFVWQHKVSAKGQVSVHAHPYSVGVAHAGELVDVHFDPTDCHLVFNDAASGQELRRRPIYRLDVVTITGLEIPPARSEQALQLSFAL